MQIHCEPQERRIVIQLKDDAEEASYVYDLIRCGRLLTAKEDYLPLPFRGQFLFKLPDRPRPIQIQVGRFEATATDRAGGQAGPHLIVACPEGQSGLLAELETALREAPPASAEEFQTDTADRLDEFSRVRKMTFAQRVIYATRTGQSGRTVLMQQPTPLLLLYLLKNPLITLLEVVAIAKMPSIDALVADQLAKMLRSNAQWAMSEELKLALAMNVKTPGGTALSLLRHLNAKSLRRIAKSDVSSSLRNAALKILAERRE